MTRFTYQLAGQTAVEDVPEDLAEFYRAQPGYLEVFDEEAAAELTGPDLNEVARQLGITDPTHTPADEKRAAIVAATNPDDPAPAGKKNKES